MQHIAPTRRDVMLTALAVAASPAPPAPDYDVMALEVVRMDFEHGWRYPVDRAMLARIAAGLRANGVTLP